LWFVGTVNVTIRFNEDELRRLDELAQRMNKTRSDVIRDLINNFDEVLKQEVEKERKRWMLIGFTAALEEAILDPTLILRFVRKNVDVLGYPDFLVGMVRVRNRIVVFSHQDRVGSQLLQLVRGRVEEEVRKEEMEIEREKDEDKEVGDGRSVSAYVIVHRGVSPRTPHVTPVSTKYKLMITNRANPPITRSAAVAAASRSGGSGGSGDAKAATTATAPENKRLVATGIPATNNSAGSRVGDSNSQASAGGGGMDPVRPVGGGSAEKPAGDFVFALITNLYHKHRDALLKLVGSVVGG